MALITKSTYPASRGATFEYVYGDESDYLESGCFPDGSKAGCAAGTPILTAPATPMARSTGLKNVLDSDAVFFGRSYTIDDGVLAPPR